MSELNYNDNMVESSSDTYTESEAGSITDAVLYDLETDIFVEIDEYNKANTIHFSNPSYHDDLVEEVTENVYNASVSANMCSESEANRHEIMESVRELADNYFNSANIYPIRSYPPDTDINELIRPYTMTEMQGKIQYLKSLPQPAQRTPEWYHLRHSLCITASNIYKALGTQAQFNQLVCEKCKPLIIPEGGTSYTNTMSSTHHGVKYEPVTVMIYEAMFPGNKVDVEFGCIRHPEYPFIGASPDGIVESGPRIGHMLEIKNTVSREISDVPIMAHWVQCQIQMETCDLDVCDYLQTNIKEVNAEEFYNDETSEYKGVVLYMISRSPGASDMKYLYMPLNIPGVAGEVESWIQSQVTLFRTEYQLFETLYWCLKEVSCVMIPRNREWFKTALPQFIKLWDTIERERVEGYQHRLPKKRESSRTSQGPVAELLNSMEEGSRSIQINLPAPPPVRLVKEDDT
jgi:putative phage-type endonuclease